MIFVMGDEIEFWQDGSKSRSWDLLGLLLISADIPAHLVLLQLSLPAA